MADPGETLSENVHRCTPDSLIAIIREFSPIIGLDPCSNERSRVHALVEWRGSGPDDDGLQLPWRWGFTYMNSPYARQIGHWTRKAAHEHRTHGTEIIALVPGRVDAKWSRESGAVLACSLKKRLHFDGEKDPAKFPSMLFYYGTQLERFHTVFSPHGKILIWNDALTANTIAAETRRQQTDQLSQARFPQTVAEAAATRLFPAPTVRRRKYGGPSPIDHADGPPDIDDPGDDPDPDDCRWDLEEP